MTVRANLILINILRTPEVNPTEVPMVRLVPCLPTPTRHPGLAIPWEILILTLGGKDFDCVTHDSLYLDSKDKLKEAVLDPFGKTANGPDAQKNKTSCNVATTIDKDVWEQQTVSKKSLQENVWAATNATKRRRSLHEPGNVVCGQLGHQVVPFCHLLADSGITQSWASDCFDPTWSSEAKSVQRLPGLPISSKPGVRPCRHNWDEKNNCQMCLWWICPPHLTWWSSIDKPIFADKHMCYFQWKINLFLNNWSWRNFLMESCGLILLLYYP